MPASAALPRGASGRPGQGPYVLPPERRLGAAPWESALDGARDESAYHVALRGDEHRHDREDGDQRARRERTDVRGAPGGEDENLNPCLLRELREVPLREHEVRWVLRLP